MSHLSCILVIILGLNLRDVTSCLSLPGLSQSSKNLNTVVELPSGTIQGKLRQSRKGVDFAIFEGVPYAEKPDRWMPPTPKAKWDGVLDCTTPGPICLQKDYITLGFKGSEDCLSLNIYTTETMKNESKEGLPIIVFLHGGGMVFDAGKYYWGDFLVDHEVILITINYRLDLLGFFSLDSPKISGNQGLRDVQLALRWIKENAPYIGGDPERVVISGQSGGSWATSMVYTSPLSESLISGAILESGAALGDLGFPAAAREEARKRSEILAKEVNCFSDGEEWSPESIESCLMTKTAEEIIEAGWNTQISYATNGNIDTFSEHGAVLPMLPEDLLSEGLFQKVPLMIGTCSQEGLLHGSAEAFDPDLLESYNDEETWNTKAFEAMFPQRVFFDVPNSCDREYAKNAKEFYFGEKMDKADVVAYLNFNFDTHFIYDNWRYMKSMANSQVPIFNYMMSFQDNTSYSFSPGTVGLGFGTSHGDELPYIFDIDPNYYDIPYANWSEDSLRHSERMCELWANFAKFGNPTPDGGSSDILGDVKWEMFNSDNPKFMDLGAEFTMRTDLDINERVSFWDKTLANYGSVEC